MSEYRDNPDPLNDHEGNTEFAAIERLLDRVAKAVPMPEYLEDGVFEVSVNHLPQRSRLRIAPTQTGVHTYVKARSLQYSFFGRFAMAASIGLAFVVGVFSVQKPSPLFSIPISAEVLSEWDYGIADAETLISLSDLSYSDIESELNALELALSDNSITDDSVNRSVHD